MQVVFDHDEFGLTQKTTFDENRRFVVDKKKHGVFNQIVSVNLKGSFQQSRLIASNLLDLSHNSIETHNSQTLNLSSGVLHWKYTRFTVCFGLPNFFDYLSHHCPFYCCCGINTISIIPQRPEKQSFQGFERLYYQPSIVSSSEDRFRFSAPPFIATNNNSLFTSMDLNWCSTPLVKPRRQRKRLKHATITSLQIDTAIIPDALSYNYVLEEDIDDDASNFSTFENQLSDPSSNYTANCLIKKPPVSPRTSSRAHDDMDLNTAGGFQPRPSGRHYFEFDYFNRSTENTTLSPKPRKRNQSFTYFLHMSNAAGDVAPFYPTEDMRISELERVRGDELDSPLSTNCPVPTVRSKLYSSFEAICTFAIENSLCRIESLEQSWMVSVWEGFNESKMVEVQREPITIRLHLCAHSICTGALLAVSTSEKLSTDESVLSLQPTLSLLQLTDSAWKGAPGEGIIALDNVPEFEFDDTTASAIEEEQTIVANHINSSNVAQMCESEHSSAIFNLTYANRTDQLRWLSEFARLKTAELSESSSVVPEFLAASCDSFRKCLAALGSSQDVSEFETQHQAGWMNYLNDLNTWLLQLQESVVTSEEFSLLLTEFATQLTYIECQLRSDTWNDKSFTTSDMEGVNRSSTHVRLLRLLRGRLASWSNYISFLCFEPGDPLDIASLGTLLRLVSSRGLITGDQDTRDALTQIRLFLHHLLTNVDSLLSSWDSQRLSDQTSAQQTEVSAIPIPTLAPQPKQRAPKKRQRSHVYPLKGEVTPSESIGLSGSGISLGHDTDDNVEELVSVTSRSSVSSETDSGDELVALPAQDCWIQECDKSSVDLLAVASNACNTKDHRPQVDLIDSEYSQPCIETLHLHSKLIDNSDKDFQPYTVYAFEPSTETRTLLETLPHQKILPMSVQHSTREISSRLHVVKRCLYSCTTVLSNKFRNLSKFSGAEQIISSVIHPKFQAMRNIFTDFITRTSIRMDKLNNARPSKQIRNIIHHVSPLILMTLCCLLVLCWLICQPSIDKSCARGPSQWFTRFLEQGHMLKKAWPPSEPPL